MRRSTILALLIAAALVAALVATLPGAFAGGVRAPAAKSAFTSVLPSKRVVAGTWGGGCIATAEAQSCSVAVSIFPMAPVAIEGQDMGVLVGLLENPNCIGDAEHPSAPPGVLCLYINEAEIVNVGKNGEGAWSVEPAPILDGRRGFRVKWTPLAAGPSQIDGVWVYRAP